MQTSGSVRQAHNDVATHLRALKELAGDLARVRAHSAEQAGVLRSLATTAFEGAADEIDEAIERIDQAWSHLRTETSSLVLAPEGTRTSYELDELPAVELGQISTHAYRGTLAQSVRIETGQLRRDTIRLRTIVEGDAGLQKTLGEDGALSLAAAHLLRVLTLTTELGTIVAEELVAAESRVLEAAQTAVQTMRAAAPQLDTTPR